MNPFQFEKISRNMKLKEDYKKLQFLLSDESLTLLPEYQQRIQVNQEYNVLIQCTHNTIYK